MKKLAAILVLFCVLICSCGSTLKDDSTVTSPDTPNAPETVIENDAEQPEDVRLSNLFTNLNLNGEFYIDYVQSPIYNGDRLNFIDFDTMQTTVVCPKPNCSHEDPEVCSAFGMSHHPTAYDGKIFFFETLYGDIDENGEATQSTAIWQAQNDGTGRVKLCTVNYSFSDGETAAITGSKIYFIGNSRSNISAITESDNCHICVFDFAKNEFKDYGELCKGWNANASILGGYNGGLYISASYMTEKFESKVDYSVSEEDWEKQRELINRENEEREKLTVRSVFRLDLNSGMIEDKGVYDIDNSLFASGGFCSYTDIETGEHILYDSEGRFSKIDCELSGNAVNGIVFRMDTLTAFELSDKRVMKLNASNIGHTDIILAFRNGNYIVKDIINKSYRTVSENEMFEK